LWYRSLFAGARGDGKQELCSTVFATAADTGPWLASASGPMLSMLLSSLTSGAAAYPLHGEGWGLGVQSGLGVTAWIVVAAAFTQKELKN